jgi:hypothetical protein
MVVSLGLVISVAADIYLITFIVASADICLTNEDSWHDASYSVLQSAH